MKTKFLILLAAVFIMQIYLASALTISSATSNPDEVQPGEKFTLDLKIENNLNQDAKDVVVSLVLNNAQNAIPFAPYLSSNEIRIDRIRSDDDEKATFDLTAFPSAVSGTYLIPVAVNYVLGNDTNNPKNESLGLVSVTINAKPAIDVSSENSFLIEGQSGKITLKIVNSGLGESKFLNVAVSPANGIKITSPSNAYIGNIDSNDFDSVDFNIITDANAPGTISLPVEITYRDFMNNEITENKIVSIKAYSREEAISLGLINKNNNLLIIISVTGALALFLIYRKIRKRNKNKRNGQ